jgi:putative addiction module CopG family antidote
MDITLTPEIERLVQEKIQRGQYASVDALVQEAVHRLVEEDEEELLETRAAIDGALEQSRVAHTCRPLACMRPWHRAVRFPAHPCILVQLPRGRIDRNTIPRPTGSE